MKHTLTEIGLGLLGTAVFSILFAMFYEYTAYGVLGLMLYFYFFGAKFSASE
ncbi:MAG: hypothetical protein MN733_33175 [Nitrososphaera sp.]|nr:hypothetical protein [Nitrososphaera sp.]